MKNRTFSASRRRASSARQSHSRIVNRKQQGIALITALFLTVLMSVLGLIMVVTVNSDMLINGYYGSYRSSFYAGDAGLNMARQKLLSQILSSANTNACTSWGASSGTGCTTGPMPTDSTSMGNWMTAVKSQYPSSAYTNVQSGGQWSEKFAVENYTGCTNQFPSTWNGAANPQQSSSTGSNGLPLNTYTYIYQLCVVGKGQGAQIVHTSETGSFQVQIQAQSTAGSNNQLSFAAYGAFINNFSPCQGPLVPGTITGPQFTNGAWNFGDSGSYLFTDPVGQQNSKASYWISGTCYQSATSSYTHRRTTVAPNFGGGLNLNQPYEPLPSNDFSQAYAVLDGMGCGALEGTTCGSGTAPATAPSNAQLNAHLKDVNGNPYPLGGTSSGVFLPYSGSTLNGGGIYVQGNADSITLQPATVGGNPVQQYTIVQGSTTTIITTNVAANTTTIKSGGTTTTLTGVPENLITGTASPATMVYVNGNLGNSPSHGTATGLSGPSQGHAAIQNGVALTVVAHGDINITGDLIYSTEPVTLNASDTEASPPPTNVLGLFTQSGNLVMSSPYSNRNLEIDGSIAAIGSNCDSTPTQCGLQTPGSINTLTIVGGRIEGNAHGVSISTANNFYDRRFNDKNLNGFSPPWFPSTTVTQGQVSQPAAPNITPSVQRLSWNTSPQ